MIDDRRADTTMTAAGAAQPKRLKLTGVNLRPPG
jgi:hypothetical protein